MRRLVDFAKYVCQPIVSKRRRLAMKVNVELDCTPEEARRLLGLPDVSKANQAYADAAAKMVKGAGSLDQLQDVAKQLAPMGEMGLKLFQQIISGATSKSDKGS
jgi:hypothetical protein